MAAKDSLASESRLFKKMTSNGLSGFECKYALPELPVLIVVTDVTVLRDNELELVMTLGLFRLLTSDEDVVDLIVILLWSLALAVEASRTVEVSRVPLAVAPALSSAMPLVCEMGLVGALLLLLLLPPRTLTTDVDLDVGAGLL